MLNTTAASMQSARQLIAAVKDLGITPPKPLNDIIAGFDVLATHAAQPDPAQTIIDAAADGELTAEHLDELINETATAQLLNEYRGPLCQRLEGRFVERFHKALCDGAADEILDLARPKFDQGAVVLAEAAQIVDINAPAVYFAEHATPEETAAFRSIKPAIAKLDEISAVARRFSARSLDWAVLDLPAGIDPRGLTDEALMCAADDLVTAGGMFSRRRTDIRSCPWLLVTPKLNTIAEAKERLREWAEASWERLGLNRGRGTFDESGEFVATPIKNPYASKHAVDA